MKTTDIKVYAKKALKLAKGYAVNLKQGLNKVLKSLKVYTVNLNKNFKKSFKSAKSQTNNLTEQLKNKSVQLKDKYSNKESVTKQNTEKDFQFKLNLNFLSNFSKFKFKKENTIRLTVLFMVVIIILPLYSYGKDNNFGLDIFNQSVDYSYSDNKINNQIIIGTDVTTLNIDWYTGNITIKTSTSSYFKFEEYSDNEISENNYFDVEKNSSVLDVSWNEYKQYDNINKTLIVYVPEDLMENLSIYINTQSSYLNISDVELAGLDINIDDGEVCIQNLIIDEFTIDANDANVELTSLDTTTVDIKTNNGNIAVNGSIRNIYASSVYGEIETLNSRDFDTLDISSIGGNINISIPKTSSFLLKLSENLGKLNNEDFDYDETTDMLYYGDMSSASYYKVTTTYSDINFSFTN